MILINLKIKIQIFFKGKVKEGSSIKFWIHLRNYNFKNSLLCKTNKSLIKAIIYLLKKMGKNLFKAQAWTKGCKVVYITI